MTNAPQPITGSLSEWALHYAAAGLDVFPVNPRNKQPLVSQKLATSDPNVVAAWWREHPNALIGHRIAPDVVVIDIDPRHGGGETWKALKATFGEPEATRSHLSGRGDGGGHLWWRRPAKGRLTIAKLDAWAREHGVGMDVASSTPGGRPHFTCGLDILQHDHRFTILPPSPHPDTGQPHRWRYGLELPPMPMPDWLAELAIELDAPAAPPPPLPPAQADSIADWYSATYTLRDVLERHRWTVVKGDGVADGSLFRHPAATHDYSASVRHGLLFVHTSSTPLRMTEPGNPHGYTPFRAFTDLDHRGDAKAAASAARTLKDGPRNPRVEVDLARMVPQAATVANPRQAPANPQPVLEEDEPWPDPAPLESVLGDVPTFPLDTLPRWAADHIHAAAGRLQTSEDLCAQLFLGTLSAMALGHAKVRLSPDWVEPLAIWLATIVPSGGGKTPADKAILTPLRKLEKRLIDAAEEEVRQGRVRKELAEKRARKALEAAGKGERDPAAEQAAFLAAEEAAGEVEKPSPRLLAQDTTPESLVGLLDRHAGRIALVSTEAELYDIVLGAYGPKVNYTPLLKAWGGEELIVDRKGGSGTPATTVRVAEALLTVSIAVQPSALELLRGRRDLTGRGFTWRFMHALPAPRGPRDVRQSLNAARLETAEDYDKRVQALGWAWAGWLVPQELHFSVDAREAFAAWAQPIIERSHGTGDLVPLVEWVSKLTATVARTAALLHLADGFDTRSPIPAGTVERAARIGDYWVGHAVALFRVWGEGGMDLEGAHRVLEWVRKHQASLFTRRDVWLGLRRYFPDPESLDRPLETLELFGWLRTTTKGGRGSGVGGRPTVAWVPHPEMLVSPAP